MSRDKYTKKKLEGTKTQRAIQKHASGGFSTLPSVYDYSVDPSSTILTLRNFRSFFSPCDLITHRVSHQLSSFKPFCPNIHLCSNPHSLSLELSDFSFCLCLPSESSRLQLSFLTCTPGSSTSLVEILP